MWEENWGDLTADQRRTFLERDALRVIEGYHEARVALALRKHRKLDDVVEELRRPINLDELAKELKRR